MLELMRKYFFAHLNEAMQILRQEQQDEETDLNFNEEQCTI
jgi:hypothetical protein